MFLKIICLLCSRNVLKLVLNSKTFLNHKKSSGYDERIPINSTELYNNTKLYDLVQIFEKKKILDILKDERVSIYTEIIILKDNSITGNNLLAGGLLKQFDFEDF